MPTFAVLDLGAVVWLALALGVGVWSERKGGSFVAGVLASVCLTPFVAALILAVRRPIRK